MIPLVFGLDPSSPSSSFCLITHLIPQNDDSIENINDQDLLVELGIGGDHTLELSRSRESLVTVSTVVGRGSLELTFHELCDLITLHQSLQRAEIVAVEVYIEPAKLWGHRFLILELRRPRHKTVYLRLDRRRSRKAVALGFLGPRTTPSYDSVSFFLPHGCKQID